MVDHHSQDFLHTEADLLISLTITSHFLSLGFSGFWGFGVRVTVRIRVRVRVRVRVRSERTGTEVRVGT